MAALSRPARDFFHFFMVFAPSSYFVPAPPLCPPERRFVRVSYHLVFFISTKSRILSFCIHKLHLAPDAFCDIIQGKGRDGHEPEHRHRRGRGGGGRNPPLLFCPLYPGIRHCLHRHPFSHRRGVFEPLPPGVRPGAHGHLPAQDQRHGRRRPAAPGGPVGAPHLRDQHGPVRREGLRGGRL